MLELVLSTVAILFTGITGVFSFLAYAKVVGLEKSTHKIQYVPVPETTGPTGPDLVKKMEKALGGRE